MACGTRLGLLPRIMDNKGEYPLHWTMNECPAVGRRSAEEQEVRQD
jgi:hypothetical protein